MSTPEVPVTPAHALTFLCGARMKNRFMLAPLTNCQSHDDGTLSADEFHWLAMRARGNFGLTMTCAAFVQPVGKGFPGQLGIHADVTIDGHERLTHAIRSHGSLAVIQLHHAGMRSPEDLIGEPPVCPSADAESGARELTLAEVHGLRDDFIAAAERAQRAGYDGVEIHGAHGYILCQFLSASINRRTDEYGGSLNNRMRIFHEILAGVREVCGSEFLVGVRLSPERFGMDVAECMAVSQSLIDSGRIDFLDVSLWDCFKGPEDVQHQDKTLLQHVTGLDQKGVRLTVAGKIATGADTQAILDAGIDFVTIGRAAILHHDFPDRVMADPTFEPISLPVTRAHLANEGLGEAFIRYMSRWKGFVSEG